MQNTWIEKNNVAQFQGANWDNWIGTKACGSVETAREYADLNAEISFFFYCRQGMVLTNGRSFNPGDAAFFSGQPWYGSAPQCDSYQKVVFNTPAFINDFPVDSAQDDATSLQWNTNISGFTTQAILGDPWNLLYASNQTSYFDTNLTTIPSTATAVLIDWHAFPNRLGQYLGNNAYPANPYKYSDEQLLAIADQHASAAVPIPAFQQIPTQLCPQATWNNDLHMYGPYGPRGWQDEYCEWSVVRDSQSDKITRIDMTCENPEYWNTLWMIDPQKVADVYSSTLSFGAPASAQIVVPVSDLYLLDPATKAAVIDPSTGRPAYNPLNKWNSGPVAVRGSSRNYGGAMHLTSTPNTLQTEMALAGGATIQRNCGNSVPQTLICCAQYGQAYRNSDPHIGQLVNQVVGGQATLGVPSRAALANPTGLYIQVPDLSGFTLPADPKLPAHACAQDCWQIVRGAAALTDPVTGMLFGATTASPQNGGNFVLHAVFQLPASWVAAGVSFTIGDITDDTGLPIQWGGQLIKKMSIGLWARPVPVSAVPASEACVLPPPTGVTPPASPVPPDYAQPLQLFHSAIWNASFNTMVSNPMNAPIPLVSNSTLIAPIVRLGQSNISMVLTCSAKLGPQGQLPVADFGPDVTVVVSHFNDNINYAVPGNSYPSQCASVNLQLSIGANAALGLRGLTLTNYGDPVQAAMPALLNIVPA
ncbi:hypothetical protein [Iodobacter fluviatilis]|uniref:hypothetical protein n=1 Tax=Iodobacter fluviatilis TaxID=537 RepID=UPI001CAA8318|nr:hypothetical protein [Iodobacter fluviatilis]